MSRARREDRVDAVRPHADRHETVQQLAAGHHAHGYCGVLADWQYAGHGHSPGESVLAASIARDIRINRETAREALQDQLALEGAAA